MFKKFKGKLVAVATGASAFALVPMAAFAGGGGSDATALLTGVQAGVDEAVLWGIGLVVLTIAGIILMIRSGRKSANT